MHLQSGKYKIIVFFTEDMLPYITHVTLYINEFKYPINECRGWSRVGGRVAWTVAYISMYKWLHLKTCDACILTKLDIRIRFFCFAHPGRHLQVRVLIQPALGDSLCYCFCQKDSTFKDAPFQSLWCVCVCAPQNSKILTNLIELQLWMMCNVTKSF